MEYKRIPFTAVEHTEIAQKEYWDFIRDKDTPDDAEIERQWIEARQKLNNMLAQLTQRQRQVCQ